MRLLGFGTVLVATALAQPRAQDPQSPVHDPPPIFRLSVSLVQLDAVVTDRRGVHVTSLRPTDFEVFQNGKRQPVTAVTYVDADERWEDASGLPPLRTSRRVQNARRTVAIVVDDRRLSFEGVHRARVSLERFMDREFRSGDVAAMLLTTRGDDQYSRELTFDRVALTAAVRRLRFSLKTGVDSPIERYGSSFGGGLDQILESGIALNAIDRVGEAVDTLATLPGRKAIILVSEGFSVYGGGLDDAPIREALQRLADRSNRAGVVLYCLDPRGLIAPNNIDPDAPSRDQQRAAAQALWETQWDLQLIAELTGGFAIVNSNDFVGGLERMLADQRGYYLIGYQPEAGTVDESASGFHKVKIRVKRKGLTVRTRAGFYGVSTE